MNTFFRRLPLTGKLLLIGLIPFCFFVYQSIQVYENKTEKLELYNNYINYIHGSQDINDLISALQEERKYSYDYVITRTMHDELVKQRPRTDALLEKLTDNKNPSLQGFTSYTKLGQLADMRQSVETLVAQPNDVMHFYSNIVFRMNTLNTLPPANTAFLQPVYNDLAIQKILSEMITYLGIIRSNIYNVLHTRKYMIETLMGTVGTHDVYKSYEEELSVKADPGLSEQYAKIRNSTALKPTLTYIDTLFSKFSFDSSYTAQQWWKTSDEGVEVLKKFQGTIWGNLYSKLNDVTNNLQSARNRTLAFIILAFFLVAGLVLYIVFIISKTLGKLERAAERIANGESGLLVKVYSDDAISSLATSISRIEQNNKELAIAATAIGKGDFEITVQPRSNKDILGNAIVSMKKGLQKYSLEMEQLVSQRTRELARSNEDLQQFAHVASHDLKEPLRKIITFSDILTGQQQDCMTEKGRIYLKKIELASRRMSAMIEAVLSYSTLSMGDHQMESIDLNKIIEGVRNDLELMIAQKNATLIFDNLPGITGIPLLVHQLFYNLVSNALKFSAVDKGPVISISTTEETHGNGNGQRSKPAGNYVHIVVKDNGIGFNPEYAEQMFAAFARLNPKNLYEGTGLGLALCRKIVDRHNGQIYAEGEEGVGSVFHILLPAT